MTGTTAVDAAVISGAFSILSTAATFLVRRREKSKEQNASGVMGFIDQLQEQAGDDRKRLAMADAANDQARTLYRQALERNDELEEQRREDLKRLRDLESEIKLLKGRKS